MSLPPVQGFASIGWDERESDHDGAPEPWDEQLAAMEASKEIFATSKDTNFAAKDEGGGEGVADATASRGEELAEDSESAKKFLTRRSIAEVLESPDGFKKAAAIASERRRQNSEAKALKELG